MFVSVVIPTFNRRKVLARTLEGIARQTSPRDTYEIIVVDDCSTDDTAAFLQGVAGTIPNLVCIRHPENRGRVVTRNDGIRAARGELVIFLDDDNVPDEGLVEAHRRHHVTRGPEHVVVMGNPRYPAESIQGSNFGRYMQSRYLGCRSPGERARLDLEDLPPQCLGTLNCSMRREDLLAVGLFDERFRHYGGEDEDLGYRLSRMGLRLVFAEDARSLHHDQVDLHRYKMKLTETARWGLRVQVEKVPGYVEGTQVRFLLPIEWRKDATGRIVAKLAVRAIANPLAVSLLERWALRTEHLGWAYLPAVYRVLTAAWVMNGYAAKGVDAPLVEYGETRER
jgi:glycosyltransferase involved in cell wall biosynthesis